MALIPLEQLDDSERLRSIVKALWKVLDDIDTAGDMAENCNDFRRYALARTHLRFEHVESDGYTLFVQQSQKNL